MIECAESCIGIFYKYSLMPEFAPVMLHNLSLCHVLIQSLKQIKTCSSSTRRSLDITHKSIMLLEREKGNKEELALPTLLRSFSQQIPTCSDVEHFGWMCPFYNLCISCPRSRPRHSSSSGVKSQTATTSINEFAVTTVVSRMLPYEYLDRELASS